MKNLFSLLSENKKTIVMGILNITPDSFSDGGLYFQNIDAAIKHGVEMVEQGADIIDIGGESTRPGADPVTTDEEIYRVIPIIDALKNEFGADVLLSIDTNKSKVADEALSAGVDIINSLGGFLNDRDLPGVCAEYNCPIVMYHIRGNPSTMQNSENLQYDVMNNIETFFREQIIFGLENGMTRHQFILDPGIGFGKTPEQNLEIIKKTHEFLSFGNPVCIGVSRKSHLGKILQDDLHLQEMPGTNERLEASLAETAVAVLNGANIIRTHDVLQTKKFLTIIDRLK